MNGLGNAVECRFWESIKQMVPTGKLHGTPNGRLNTPLVLKKGYDRCWAGIAKINCCWDFKISRSLLARNIHGGERQIHTRRKHYLERSKAVLQRELCSVQRYESWNCTVLDIDNIDRNASLVWISYEWSNEETPCSILMQRFRANYAGKL